MVKWNTRFCTILKRKTTQHCRTLFLHCPVKFYSWAERGKKRAQSIPHNHRQRDRKVVPGFRQTTPLCSLSHWSKSPNVFWSVPNVQLLTHNQVDPIRSTISSSFFVSSFLKQTKLLFLFVSSSYSNVTFFFMPFSSLARRYFNPFQRCHFLRSISKAYQF